MDESLTGLMTIIGPIILLGLLVWLVARSRRSGTRTTDTSAQTERATDRLYDQEEQRRRDGTDGL